MVKKITRVGIHSPDIPRMRQYIGIACAEHDHITTISDVIAISHGATVNRICADPYPRIHISRASCIVMDIKTLRNYETEISYTGKLELPSINPIILKENTCTSTHTYDRHIRPWTHHMQSHSQLSLQNSTCFSRLMNDNWRSQLI